MPTNGRMNKRIVIYSYKGILQTSKTGKFMTIDNNINKQYWVKESRKKEYTLDGSISIKFKIVREIGKITCGVRC